MLASCAMLLIIVGVGVLALTKGSPSGFRPDMATVALGEKLFRDPRLSGDGRTSCASCHVPERSFSDGKPVALGLKGRKGTRNTPSLTASIASSRTSFFWDGRRTRLEDAVMDPFSNPVEMGLPDRSTIATRVSSLPDYAVWLTPSSSTSPNAIDQQVADGLAAYLRAIPTNPTRFERFVRGDANAIDEREKLGMSLFSGKAQCATCHELGGARLTDDAFHRSGVTMEDIAMRLPELTRGILERSLSGSALGDRVATHHDEAQLGHFSVSHKANDVETFATPSLREVRLTAPYMHDGSVVTLDDAVDREVYYRGLDTGYPIGLTAQERSDLRAFLETL